ncbi:MAG: TPM domain-containing protein [Elusimicrobia bacterium]|nr:TPM domain-containing protein [Elusimicrobiota bacterium]
MVLLAAAALARPGAALDVPFLSGRVVDDARLLDAASAARLEQTLKDHEAKTGHQVVVLTLPSLDGEEIEDYSLKVSRTWKLGRKGKDDGVLFLISRDDRKLRIEVGYGLEGILPDALCGRIIRDVVAPHLRAGDYAGGVSAGVDAILSVIDGTYSPGAEPPPFAPSHGEMGDSLGEKILLSVFVLSLLGLFEAVGLVGAAQGWFLYFFLIPFWSAFPMALWGATVGSVALGLHLTLFPILKLLIGRSDWGKAAAKKMGVGRSKVYTGASGWSTGFISGGGFGGFGGSGGFSGGGGSFGGGGASGGW